MVCTIATSGLKMWSGWFQGAPTHSKLVAFCPKDQQHDRGWCPVTWPLRGVTPPHDLSGTRPASRQYVPSKPKSWLWDVSGKEIWTRMRFFAREYQQVRAPTKHAQRNQHFATGSQHQSETPWGPCQFIILVEFSQTARAQLRWNTAFMHHSVAWESAVEASVWAHEHWQDHCLTRALDAHGLLRRGEVLRMVYVCLGQHPDPLWDHPRHCELRS